MTARWKSTFPGKYLEGGKEAGGQLVDQCLLLRIDEGEVRVLMVSEQCQMMIHKKPLDGLSAVGGNSEYTFYKPGDPKYADLEANLKKDIPSSSTPSTSGRAARLWMADFILKDAEDGTKGKTEYVVGEFNCRASACPSSRRSAARRRSRTSPTRTTTTAAR